MLALPYLFPQTISKKIKGWINGNINGRISFSGTSLSFFKKFPALTLTLQDVTLKGSAPFDKDTLIAAKEISLGIDLSPIGIPHNIPSTQDKPKICLGNGKKEDELKGTVDDLEN